MENVFSAKALNDNEKLMVTEIDQALQYLNTQQKYYQKTWKAKIFRDGTVAIREIDKDKKVKHIKTCYSIEEAKVYAKDVEIAQYIGYKKVHGFLLPHQAEKLEKTTNAKIGQKNKEEDQHAKHYAAWKAKKKWLPNKK